MWCVDQLVGHTPRMIDRWLIHKPSWKMNAWIHSYRFTTQVNWILFYGSGLMHRKGSRQGLKKGFHVLLVVTMKTWSINRCAVWHKRPASNSKLSNFPPCPNRLCSIKWCKSHVLAFEEEKNNKKKQDSIRNLINIICGKACGWQCN